MWKRMGMAFLAAACACTPKPKSDAAQSAGGSDKTDGRAVFVQAKKQDLVVSGSFRGSVQSSVRVDLRAETKLKLKRALVSNGQNVAKGTLLFEIDMSDLSKRKKDAQDRLASLRLEITGARSRDGFARKSLDRKIALSAKGIIAEKEREEASKSAQQADIDVKTKVLEIERAKGDLEEILAQEKVVRITAPIDGVASDLVAVKAGEEVNQGQLLLTLSDPRKLVLAALVDETNATRVKPGMPASVELDAFSGKSFAATVREIAFNAEAQGGYGAAASGLSQYKAILSLENPPPGLQNGFEGNAIVVFSKAPAAVVVPLAALKSADGKSFVLASRSASGSAAPKEVEVGLKSDLEAEIKAGLTGNEYVVIGESQ